VGQGAPDHALTLAYLPLALLVTCLLAGLFAFAFRLGFTPFLISLGLFAALIGGVALTTGQWRTSTAAGTRMTIGHVGLVCLVGGVALALPDAVPELMAWSLASAGAVAGAIIGVENWLTEKIAAAGPFSRRLAREAHGLLVLALALLLWRSGRVEAWVLAAGAIHYLVMVISFAGATRPEPLRCPPWPLVDFAVIIALAGALVPMVPPLYAGALCGLATILAIASGGVATGWIARKRH